MKAVPLDSFHPAVAAWFARRFGAPTVPQEQAWPSIRARRHTLIAAPTGSGKTLAAFLAAIDDLVRQSLDAGSLPDATQVVYVSPLKALSNDIRRNLEEPLGGIRDELRARGLGEVQIRTVVRTGDTPGAERTAMAKRPPHILVTTPESLYILLTSESGRRMLRTARTAIVDEIHAIADDKRGAHLALSLERLDALVRAAGGELLRVGLSATQRPVERVARFLVGAAEDAPAAAIVDVGHRRNLDLALELPPSPLEAVMSGEVWGEVYDRLAELVRQHRTTLVFVNTRRLAERAARHLGERLGAEQVGTHHGSLSREIRQDAEQKLKEGRLRALVATASLELGIDIGDIDLVCTLGSPRSISVLLQRVGRSGHRLDALPKGRIFPTSRDELVECAALLGAVRRGELEELIVPEGPLDILAQQIVASVACEEWSEDGLYALARRAWPYRELARQAFDDVIGMLADGFATRRGRRGAFVHRDRVHGRLRGRRGARLAAITSGGAIPDNADYHVVLEPQGTFIGTVNEDFAIESMAGEVFQLGTSSWRIRRIEPGRVLVEDAHGQPPTIPFWLGEAPGRSAELSAAVSRLRAEVEGGTELALTPQVAEPLVEYLASARAALGALPTQRRLVLERFFDEAGNQHVVIHSPFGSRVNRAWGLALRKRMCRTFNFELQAAAGEDAIVLSLGPTHSFPVGELFGWLRSATVREVLVQALLDAPVFPVRWRWNAERSLAILRRRGGRRVPPRILRMEAEDLVAVVFPDQLACLENIPGDREIPDHPLVAQTIRDCLEEAMDLPGLEALLASIERGEIDLVARELTEPSPLAHEILNARPYAFLDDAPLEERRTQAVHARRWLDAETAADLGRLDAEAIARVRREAWPEADSTDELHDALVTLGFLTREEGTRWAPLFADLVAAARAAELHASEDGPVLWVAAERLPELRAALPQARLEPALEPPASLAARSWAPEEACVELLRGRLESLGPVTARTLTAQCGLAPGDVAIVLGALEAEGFVLRGQFTPGASEPEWCERRLLARIHRGTLDRLRREIEPVTKLEFMRFLLRWQRVASDARAAGAESLAVLLEQLEGFEAPAAAWEGELLPARLAEYDPVWLDALCLAGRFAWLRASAPSSPDGPRAAPIRTTPIALLPREQLAAWRRPSTGVVLTADAQAARDWLERRGASFFDEIRGGTGLLRTQVESALGELVGAGMATADSFTGLRALLTPSDRRPGIAGRHVRAGAVFGMEHAGRWSLLREPTAAGDRVQHVAEALLRRYGVVFRALLEREGGLPPWRELLRAYRRLEARGEIRGGRFVDGFSGEQFARPEAVGALRAERREKPGGELVAISAADPLNLVGIVLPGERVPALAGNRILFRDGLVLATLVAGQTRWLEELGTAEGWEAQNALLRRKVPPQLRAYLGR
ncbi:MAG TPA: DEAD/DEAH box helicase [Candidatus Polarisedimenticolaceae bacterium]|nr:DEAD/DEAH box helicase [Candidatus Polarisedimenticolaceae bacterium]